MLLTLLKQRPEEWALRDAWPANTNLHWLIYLLKSFYAACVSPRAWDIGMYDFIKIMSVSSDMNILRFIQLKIKAYNKKINVNRF